MIGTETMADTIASAVLILNEWDEVDVDHSLIPDGWTYLGSGSYRHAFLAPDGFVYKVNLSNDWNTSGWGMNAHVHSEYTALSSLIFGIARMARCDYFTDSDVMVQEYVEGERITNWNELDEVCAILRSMVNVDIDINSGNVRKVDGQFVLIDW